MSNPQRSSGIEGVRCTPPLEYVSGSRQEEQKPVPTGRRQGSIERNGSEHDSAHPGPTPTSRKRRSTMAERLSLHVRFKNIPDDPAPEERPFPKSKRKRPSLIDYSDMRRASTVQSQNDRRTCRQNECLQGYSRIVYRLHNFLTKRILVKLILHVAKHPFLYIFVVAAVSMLLAGFAYGTGSLEVETDPDLLWIPQDSNPLQNKKWIQNESGFPPTGRNNRLLIHANGENVLGYEGARRAFLALDAVRGTEGYDQLCKSTGVREESQCKLVSVTSFWQGSDIKAFEESISSSSGSKDDATIEALSSSVFADGTPVSRSAIFGNPQLTTYNSSLISATSFRTILFLPASMEDIVKGFETRAASNVLKLSDEWMNGGDRFRVEILNDQVVDDEIKRALSKDLPLVYTTFVIMAIFTMLAMTRFQKDRSGRRFVLSSGLLGVGALVTVLLSLITGFGLCALCKIPLTSVGQVLPFVLVGIGLDDAFVLSGAFEQTNPESSLEERLELMTNEAGASITVTTLTDVLAFALGTTASIPTIQWFSAYASVCVFTDFVYQITFFVALLVLDQRRMKANRYDFLPCIRASKRMDVSNGEACDGVEAKKLSVPQHLMLTYARFIMRPVCRVIVCLSFAALLAVGAIYASHATQDFKLTEMTTDDSFVDRYFDNEALHFGSGSGTLDIAIYFRDIDVTSKTGQDAIFGYVDQLVAGVKYIHEPPEFLWLKDFLRYANMTSEGNKTTYMSPEEFNRTVTDFLNVEAYDLLYSDHIVRDPTTGLVTASRTFATLSVDLDDAKSQVDAYNEVNEVTASQPMNQESEINHLFSHHLRYQEFEHYRIISGDLLVSLALGIVAVTFVSICFLPHPVGSLICVACVVAVDVELIGLLTMAGFYINSITTLLLIMSIGLVVDFCMHVVHAFFLASSTDQEISKKERVIVAMTHIGVSVLLGGISSFLGVAPLAFSSATTFWTFFVIFTGMIVLGLAHGLVLIPVVLSMVGPSLSNDRETVELAEREAEMLSMSSQSTLSVLSKKAKMDEMLAQLSREEGGFRGIALLRMKTSFKSALGIEVYPDIESYQSTRAIRSKRANGCIPSSSLESTTVNEADPKETGSAARSDFSLPIIQETQGKDMRESIVIPV